MVNHLRSAKNRWRLEYGTCVSLHRQGGWRHLLSILLFLAFDYRKSTNAQMTQRILRAKRPQCIILHLHTVHICGMCVHMAYLYTYFLIFKMYSLGLGHYSQLALHKVVLCSICNMISKYIFRINHRPKNIKHLQSEPHHSGSAAFGQVIFWPHLL